MAYYTPPVMKQYSLFLYRGILYHDFLDCAMQLKQVSPELIKLEGINIGFTNKNEFYAYIKEHAQHYKKQKQKHVKYLNREEALSPS